MDKIASHSAEALDRLCELFKVKPNVRAYITALCTPAQAFEDVLYQVLTERALDTAIGVQLDALGTIVGQPRNGLSDVDFKRYMRARIKTNRSSGLTNELYHIARLIINDSAATLRYDPSYPAAGIMRISDIPFDSDLAAILIKFLRDAASAGVRIILEWSVIDPEDTFFWDTTAWDDGLLWVSSIE